MENVVGGQLVFIQLAVGLLMFWELGQYEGDVGDSDCVLCENCCSQSSS